MKITKIALFASVAFSSSIVLATSNSEISLKQIMSDPDWIARSPENIKWADDNQSVYYQQKQLASPVKDTFVYSLSSKSHAKVADSQQLELASHQGKLNADASIKVFTHHDDVFVKTMATGTIIQLTKTHAKEKNVLFLNDGRVAYNVDFSFYAHDLKTGLKEELVRLENTKANGSDKQDSFLEAQQKRLFEIVRKRERDADLKAGQKRAYKQADTTYVSETVSFDDKTSIDQASLSPNGRWLFVATSDKERFQGKNDSMPTWVNKSGYVEPQVVREHVGNAAPFDQALWLVDLEDGSKTQLEKSGLKRIKDDVFASAKKENAKAAGKKYRSPKKSERKQRAAFIYQWGGADGGIHWSDDGEAIAVNLYAYDNKDRWIVGVDFDEKALTTYHHLSDEAWVNKADHMQLGFLPNSHTLYFLSEDTGYANLYVKEKGKGKARNLTNGKYVVDQLTPSNDGEWIYFKANIEHPGEYEIFRVNTKSAKIEQLTNLDGMTDYQLSPDGTQLALLHSSLLRPQELYIQPAQTDARALQVTSTVTDEFSAKPWVKPEIVAVKSSHFDGEVYSRLYLPAAEDKTKASKDGKAPAVIFVHGAGYLQNAHKGWSGYFREFMFHTLLAKQGITVLDMDYRASQGYGRDHRTAIYRQMGTPELEDFKDGVDYLVKQHGIDPKRVGIYGGSYGGFMTFMALFKEPELFAAGASLRPVTDWAHYNHWYTAPILNTPEIDPIAYNRSSPIEFAEGLNKPLLICHGMLDDNVFFKDSVRLVQKLIELEKENFELAVYPIEPHGFKEPSSWLDEYRRIYKLFQQTIL